MKKKINILLSLVLALSLMFALAACGGGGGTTNNGGDTTTNNGGDTTTNSGGSDNKTYTIVVTNHDSSTSVGQQYVETVLGQIAEESGGRLNFSFSSGGSLFASGEAVAAVRDGSADICWNSTSITNGVFPISEFINLPLNGITCARMASKVFRDMLAEIPECAAEFSDFYVFEAQACSTAPLSTVDKKIESPDDLKGLSIRTAGTVQSNYIQLLGASPSSMPTADVYEALEKGIVKGMTNDWHNIDCFNLYEVVKYVMDYPINVTSCFLLMNKNTYNNLPEDLQALFDKYNDYASDMAGYYWDCMQTVISEKGAGWGLEIYQPNQEVYDYMTQDSFKETMSDWYVNYLVKDNGYENGQEIYDKCMEIVARYADEYADPFAEPMYIEDWDMTSVENYQ